MGDEEKPGVLELMIGHELAMQGLYEACAEAFPERHELWSRLASDEQEHAGLLATLRSVSPLEMRATYARFKPQPIKTSTQYAREQTVRVREGLLTDVEAFALAVDLETALLEGHSIKLAPSAPMAIRPVLMELAAGDTRHRAAVKAALDAAKAAGPSFE
jgi:rubrerythrin